MCVDDVSRARERCASVVRTVRVFCLRTPSRARQSLMSVREFFLGKKQSTDWQRNLQSDLAD